MPKKSPLSSNYIREKAWRQPYSSKLENTVENRELVQSMEAVINSEDGYEAMVIWDWDHGNGIRIEINSTDILNCPYIVSSWISGGKVCVKDRVLTIYGERRIAEWDDWFARLGKLVDKLSDLVGNLEGGEAE